MKLQTHAKVTIASKTHVRSPPRRNPPSCGKYVE